MPRVSESPASLSALGDLNFVYAYVGAESRLMEPAERGLKAGNVITQSTFWSPAWAPARRTEGFKSFARDAGLVDYWRQRGWPDLCRPLGEKRFRLRLTASRQKKARHKAGQVQGETVRSKKSPKLAE